MQTNAAVLSCPADQAICGSATSAFAVSNSFASASTPGGHSKTRSPRKNATGEFARNTDVDVNEARQSACLSGRGRARSSWQPRRGMPGASNHLHVPGTCAQPIWRVKSKPSLDDTRQLQCQCSMWPARRCIQHPCTKCLQAAASADGCSACAQDMLQSQAFATRHSVGKTSGKVVCCELNSQRTVNHVAHSPGCKCAGGALKGAADSKHARAATCEAVLQMDMHTSWQRASRAAYTAHAGRPCAAAVPAAVTLSKGSGTDAVLR